MTMTKLMMVSTDSKLQKLVAMLASDQDGEVINAARMIGRYLRTIGRDWNDVAAAIVLPPQAPDLPIDSDWRSLALSLLSVRGLKAIERDFLHNMTRAEAPTEKQRKWLADLYLRHSE